MIGKFPCERIYGVDTRLADLMPVVCNWQRMMAGPLLSLFLIFIRCWSKLCAAGRSCCYHCERLWCCCWCRSCNKITRRPCNIILTFLVIYLFRNLSGQIYSFTSPHVTWEGMLNNNSSVWKPQSMYSLQRILLLSLEYPDWIFFFE